jgi:uncharacterized protein (TIGR02266 family)
MDDKRKHTRIPVTARVSTVNGDKKDFYFTKDLSIGGVFLVTEREIPVDTVINLEISVQGISDLLRIKGKVVRIEKREDKVEGVGIKFIDMDASSVESLQSFLKDS